MLKGAYKFEKYSAALPYKEGDVIQNWSGVQGNQSLMHTHIWLWYM